MYCSFFLKTMMFVFNGSIFLAGVAMLAMGIWLILGDGSLMELLGNIDHVPGGLAQLAPVSYLLIAIGRALLIIGFLGCRGAVRENRCMTMTFFTLLWIIFMAEIAAAVLAYVFKAEAADIFKDLDDTIVENFEKKSCRYPVPCLVYHHLQCCGYHNYTNFRNLTKYHPPCCNSTLVVESAGCTAAIAQRSVAAMVVSLVLYKDIPPK
ncbi:unnamed protein product [Arctogadus glacialis]